MKDLFSLCLGPQKTEELQKQQQTIQRQLKELKINRGLGKIDQETFDLTKEHLLTQMAEIDKELGNEISKISNLENLLQSAMEKMRKLAAIWDSSDLERRRVLKNLVS